MKNLYVKEQFDIFKQLLKYAIYDINNSLSEEQLINEIYFKTIKSILKYTLEKENNIQEDINIIQVLVTVINAYHTLLKLCKENQITVNFLYSPTGLEWSQHKQEIIGFTSNIKKVDTFQEYVENLIKDGVKQIFVYDIFSKYSNRCGYLFIRSYHSLSECLFTTDYVSNDMTKKMEQQLDGNQFRIKKINDGNLYNKYFEQIRESMLYYIAKTYKVPRQFLTVE